MFIEMLQNCPVFNDGVWEGVKDDPAGKQIMLADGKPLRVRGRHQGHQARRRTCVPEIVDVGDGPGKTPVASSLVHTRAGLAAVRAPARAARAARLPDADGRALPRRTSRPTTQLATAQVDDAIAKQGPGDLNKLMYSGMTWEVGADGERRDPS